jgi:hypothetical protein
MVAYKYIKLNEEIWNIFLFQGGVGGLKGLNKKWLLIVTSKKVTITKLRVVVHRNSAYKKQKANWHIFWEKCWKKIPIE